MKFKIALLYILAYCTAAYSQNINQSVTVTNQYETKFSDFQKSGTQVHIPDSLYEFDYNFDYSVFDSPYKGSYEFTPYQIQVTPEPMTFDGKKFLFRAGAGYTLHPELDIYWTPVTKEKFTFGLYNQGRGYVGKYGTGTLGASTLSSFSGYDLSDKFELQSHIAFRASVLDIKASYDGIFTADDTYNSSLNSGYVYLGLRSLPRLMRNFSYKANIDFRYSKGCMPITAAYNQMGESILKLGGSIGPRIDNRFTLLIDFQFESYKSNHIDSQSSATSTAGKIDISPKLLFQAGAFDLEAGFGIDYLMSSESNGFILAPRVNIGVDIFSKSAKAYAEVQGGRNIISEYSLKHFNHFYAFNMISRPVTTREKYDLALGLDGRIGRAFQYNLRGGYKSMADMPLPYLRSIEFVDINMAYASLDLNVDTERFTLDGSLNWNYSIQKEVIQAFAPPALSGELSARYNSMRRIFIGLELSGLSERVLLDSSGLALPAYLDLGLSFEYRIRQNFGLWLKGGNLLGQDIENYPGFVISGPYFTAGILLRQ